MTGDDRNEPGRPSLRAGFRRNAGSSRLPSGSSLTRLLRDAYAPPDDLPYWDRLEARIMAGIRGHADRGAVDGWGAAFQVWARAGLAAACIVALAAGAAAWSSRGTAARVAYEAIVDVPTPAVVQTDSRFINVSEREATGRYVFSH